MAKVLRNGDSLYPFFGDKISFIRGLDPLGLQNNSEATFTMLLSGLNNVTGRIRYYSFYCWLLDQYSLMIGSTDPKKQEAFIRKGEYLHALIVSNSKEEFNNIPGSNYSIIQLKNDNELINLDAGVYTAGGKTEGSYWKYQNGAFGQYYVASLISMGIILRRDEDSRLYVRSNKDDTGFFVSGEELAKAFDQNIDTANKTQFLENIISGVVTKNELSELFNSFNPLIVPESEESTLLFKMLLQSDSPLIVDNDYKTYHRRTSIKALLNFFESEMFADKKELAFTTNIYLNKGNLENSKELDYLLFGWYYYQFNDFWQYANTAIFNGLMYNLSQEFGLQSIPLLLFLQQQSQSIIPIMERLCNFQIGTITKVSEIIEGIGKSSEINELFLYEIIRNSEGSDRIAASLLLIFYLYYSNKNDLEKLRNYGNQNNIIRDGEASNFFLKEFHSKLNLSVEIFVFEFFKIHSILRHHYVAFRKIGGGTQTTQKFILEDGNIRYIDNFSPAFTSPRLQTLYAFLRDLALITSNNITEKGAKQIENRDLWN